MRCRWCDEQIGIASWGWVHISSGDLGCEPYENGDHRIIYSGDIGQYRMASAAPLPVIDGSVAMSAGAARAVAAPPRGHPYDMPEGAPRPPAVCAYMIARETPYESWLWGCAPTCDLLHLVQWAKMTGTRVELTEYRTPADPKPPEDWENMVSPGGFLIWAPQPWAVTIWSNP